MLDCALGQPSVLRGRNCNRPRDADYIGPVVFRDKQRGRCFRF